MDFSAVKYIPDTHIKELTRIKPEKTESITLLNLALITHILNNGSECKIHQETHYDLIKVNKNYIHYSLTKGSFIHCGLAGMWCKCSCQRADVTAPDHPQSTQEGENPEPSFINDAEAQIHAKILCKNFPVQKVWLDLHTGLHKARRWKIKLQVKCTASVGFHQELTLLIEIIGIVSGIH